MQTQLNSSFLAYAFYRDGILSVKFKTGKTFEYVATKAHYDALVSAESAGKYYSSEIKGKLPIYNEALPQSPNNQKSGTGLSEHYDL